MEMMCQLEPVSFDTSQACAAETKENYLILKFSIEDFENRFAAN